MVASDTHTNIIVLLYFFLQLFKGLGLQSFFVVSDIKLNDEPKNVTEIFAGHHGIKYFFYTFTKV